MGCKTNGGITIWQKKDGFDSNGVLDVIGEREEKDGFQTNGEIEVAKKNNGFDNEFL